MLRQTLVTAFAELRFRSGLAALCLGLALLSLWFMPGCDLTARRTPPTPPAAETPDTAPTAPPMDSTVVQGQPAGAETPARVSQFQEDTDSLTLIPWPRTVIPPDTLERVEERIIASYEHYKAGEITLEEHNERADQFYIQEFGILTYVRGLIENGQMGVTASTYADKAYAEDPDDFETLLTWVFIGGTAVEVFGEEKTAALRRLYQMDPHHPYVLHELALHIYGRQPAEALDYAQKAQRLEPRYIPQGVDGLCHYQMGNYEQALAAFKRAHAAAPERLKRATLERIEHVRDTLASSPADEVVRQSMRDNGHTIMGHILWARH